jgi:hypothetical protein
VLQGAGDFLYVSLTAAVVNRKIKFYLLIWEEKLFIKLCLNSHRIIAAETEASLWKNHLVQVPLVVHETLALEMNQLSEPLSTLDSHKEQISPLCFTCLVAIDPRINTTLTFFEFGQRHGHHFLLELGNIKQWWRSKLLRSVGSEDSSGTKHLLEVDDFLVFLPVLFDLVVGKKRLTYVYLLLVTDSYCLLVLFLAGDFNEDFDWILYHYLFNSTVLVLRMLKWARQMNGKLERERKSVLALPDLLVSELKP